MQVRPADAIDAPRLTTLLRELASEDLVDIRIELPDRELSADESRLLLQMVRSMGGEVLVGVERDAAVGLVVLTPAASDPDSRRMGLAIAVNAGSRGRGGGRALLEGTIVWARGAGVAALDLRVRPGNLAAVRLYRALGFAERPDRPADPAAKHLSMTLAL